MQGRMLISQLLYKRCSLSCPLVLAQKTAKYKKLFFRFSLILRPER